MDEKAVSGSIRKGAAIALPIGILAVLGLALLVSAQSPAVRVGKTAAPSALYPNDYVEYTVVFTNSSASAVRLLVITDTLPADFTFKAMIAGSDITAYPVGAAGAIVWTGPYTVPAASALSLIYKVQVDAVASPGPHANRLEARLESADVISDTAPVTVLGVALGGAKTASLGQVRDRDPVDYTVTLTNSGTVEAILSAITDTLPADFTFQQMVAGPLPDPTQQGNTLAWTGPITIGAGSSLAFTYRVLADGLVGQVYYNSAEAAHDGEVVGPYQAGVTILARVFYGYLPLLVKTEESGPPPPTYRLAYDSKPGDNYEIFAVNADGTDLVNVSNAAGGDLTPVWSPDGSKIAWVSFASGTGEILVANADGSGKINVSNHAKEDRTPAWSPDGSKIAFSSYREDRWEVYTVNADGTGLAKMTAHACQSHDPVWSPDGAKIAYVCGLDQWAEVYVRDADDYAGATAVRLTENEVPDEALDWSPDSTRLAYVRYDGRNRKDSDIYIVDISAGVNTRITYNEYADYSPQWSPAGNKIAFSTYLDGSYEIAIMDPDGANVVNLTQTAGGDWVPRWSPDGLKISFISKRDGNKELYVMDADGSNQFRLTYTDMDESAHDWQPQAQ